MPFPVTSPVSSSPFQPGVLPLAFPHKISYSLLMEKVLGFIGRYQMIVSGDKIVAGISGGADSVCLLFVLLELREKMGIEIVAVHVNHGLRGENAKRDEVFVQEL